MAEVRVYKVTTLQGVKPNSIVALKIPNQNKFDLFVTDLQGVPYSLNTPTSGVTNITNTDGNLIINGGTLKNINLSPTILDLINTALRPGDNISELNNDLSYISINNKVVGETLLGNLNGINATFTIQNPLHVGSEKIFVNGNRQQKPSDYNISGQTIIFTFSPESTETILVDYIKQ
jgi:hypothetical protein